jgi:hypothetical protein
MNIHEIDWRKSSVRQILKALSQGLDANRQQFDEGGDVDDALEYEDDLCGIAFVTAQAYITGVVADVNALLRGKRPPVGKHELLKSANPIVADTKLTRMQLCDTMANYYKHRDQWPDWTDTDAAAGRTVELLRTAGFTQGNQHLSTTVARLLFGNVEVESLVPLVDMLSAGRKRAGKGTGNNCCSIYGDTVPFAVARGLISGFARTAAGTGLRGR